MPPFVAVFVKLRWEFPVRLRRDDRNDPRVIQIFTQPVGIKCAIRKEHFAGNALNYLRRFAQIMGLVYMKVPLPNGDYSMDHSATLVLLDPQGRQAGLVRPPLDGKAIGEDLGRLAGATR